MKRSQLGLLTKGAYSLKLNRAYCFVTVILSSSKHSKCLKFLLPIGHLLFNILGAIRSPLEHLPKWIAFKCLFWTLLWCLRSFRSLLYKITFNRIPLFQDSQWILLIWPAQKPSTYLKILVTSLRELQLWEPLIRNSELITRATLLAKTSTLIFSKVPPQRYQSLTNSVQGPLNSRHHLLFLSQYRLPNYQPRKRSKMVKSKFRGQKMLPCNAV